MLYMLQPLVIRGPVSGQWVCVWFRWKTTKKGGKENMDRKRKWAACVIPTNTQTALILYPQSANYWFWQRLLSRRPLARPKSGCLCRRAVPNCTCIWTVNIARSWLRLCAVQVLFLSCAAPAHNKLKNPVPELAACVYTFHIIAATHRREHQKEATVISIFYFFFLEADFKVDCRRAVWKAKLLHLLPWPQMRRNTLKPAGCVCM